MANKNAKNVTNGTDIFVVTPGNMGKGVKYNETTKQYDVAVGSGLAINENGDVFTVNKPEIRTFGNGTGKIVHKQAITDAGGFIEVSGVIALPLPPDPASLLNLGGNTPQIATYQEQQRQASGISSLVVYGGTGKADGAALGIFYPGVELYYHEVGFLLYLADYGIDELVSAVATAGDLPGWKKETAWVVSSLEKQAYVPIGIHVYMVPGDTACSVSYSIKGTKLKK